MELDKAFRPVRGADGRLQPVLTLPGDTLETTALMVGMTAASTVLAVSLILRAFGASLAVGALPLAPLLAVSLGVLAGEMFSGTFHWATDNYGRLETPVVGFACAAFQGHHLAPWTISHRTVANNVYKIASATIPLSLLAVALFVDLLKQFPKPDLVASESVHLPPALRASCRDVYPRVTHIARAPDSLS